MAKKPASLTSDLLARKGDAGPSSVDPVSRVTIAPGRQPNLSGIGAGEDPSQRLYASLATERPEMYGTDEEERPRPPEPEIIYTPEEEDGGGRARLVAGAFVGLALLGGVIVALSLNDGGSGVAPVAPDVTAIPDEAPAAPAPAQVAQAPAAPETQANPEAAVPGAEEEAPELRTSAEPAAPAPAEAPAASESAPTSITPPALQSEAEAPAAAEPVPEKVAAAEPAAPAPAVASGGAYVVQIMALREEGAAKSAWAALQKKHPAILGGHALDIEKADLGDKGTYYRVRAAGFETKADAQSACSSLKSAGQDCLVKAR
ncbi:MAG: hypothetical protein CVT81_13995 [Alphaproteobacteria bacterium HGW-Alphaproteobacteria-3]|nr:MAG: hypothetical protein CVT81_13995 [Alphaproteobacteria bacterium HGW-Alphaproteobacteria-3]